MNILDEPRVLVLNANWQVINQITVADAFSMMQSDAATAIDNENDCFVPTKHSDWLKLSVRPSDDSIGTVRGRIRVPRVIIAVNWKGIVAKKPRLTMENLAARDNGCCQYTGKRLSKNQMSMEHFIPKSHGGKKEWENILLVDKNVNSMRGNLPLEKVGLKPLKNPIAPRARTKAETIKNIYGFPEWDIFLKKAAA